MSFSLLVPAAGSGERLGESLPKALVDVGGQPLVIRAIRPFLEFEECREVILAVPAAHFAEFRAAIERLKDDRIRCAAGGEVRQQSVHAALQALKNDSEIVLVHDAARALVSRELIQRVLDKIAEGVAAAIPGIQATDTVKLSRGGMTEVQATLERRDVFMIQTPQAVRTDLFREAHQRAERESWFASDDAGLIERFDLGSVGIVAGEEENFKITTPFDLDRARSLLRQTASRAR